ncbi:MAG: AMP-binding protein [Nocardioides sp.]|uniref:AMP-binding protein n=1 Tax=Nocardioides sp. TaxID=35761 RepID=UPI003F0D3FF6
MPQADTASLAVPPATFSAMIAARRDDDAVALWFEGTSWTWREVVSEAARRAGVAQALLADRPDGSPHHLGVFLENTAEHLFWWLGCALSGVTYVGINPTRRGPDLAHDISFTECAAVVVDATRAPLLEGVAPLPPVVDVDSPAYAATLGAAAPAEQTTVAEQAILSLVFTSGTTSAPKAVICSQGRMARIAATQVERRALTRDDTFYVVMPMFHSNALMAGIAPAVATGGTIVLRRRFSASQFLPDVRAHGVTFFNYVGKPLNYVLATPEQPDDADNTLRIAFGNEASERDIAAFSARFGCRVIDGFGSSEGEIQIVRTPDTPPGSLGVSAREGTVVMDPDTLTECPRAVFDDDGVLLNAEDAVGEIVQTNGGELFEGYWNNPEAEAARVRDGASWSGDLAYRDEAGFWYFAGRTADWLRVDGENLAAAPVERLLGRFAAFDAVAVVAAPDDAVGDQVYAVAEMRDDVTFEPDEFARFLAAQPDLGAKWAPRWVRIVGDLPRTPTNKVVKRSLDPRPVPGTRADGSPDLYVRSGSALEYRPA